MLTVLCFAIPTGSFKETTARTTTGYCVTFLQVSNAALQHTPSVCSQYMVLNRRLEIKTSFIKNSLQFMKRFWWTILQSSQFVCRVLQVLFCLSGMRKLESSPIIKLKAYQISLVYLELECFYSTKMRIQLSLLTKQLSGIFPIFSWAVYLYSIWNLMLYTKSLIYDI